jgi:uncharacterized protein DUF1835
VLHVTNGDSATAVIEAAGVGGRVLPWRDVLHEGPVPAVPRDELRRVRARFLAADGWVSYEEALRTLEERDRALVEADEVVLWFEHDMFDQLQLMEVLVRLGDAPAELVQSDRYLGELPAADGPRLWASRRPVSEEQSRLAARVWDAFTAGRLEELVQVDDRALPFLGAALQRLLQELPWTRDGLSLTERNVLEAVADGAADRSAIFGAVSAREEPRFQGDAVVWLVLDRLTPLAVTPELGLTGLGRALLAGEADWARDGALERWLGGVHLRGPALEWRWDQPSRTVRRSR